MTRDWRFNGCRVAGRRVVCSFRPYRFLGGRCQIFEDQGAEGGPTLEGRSDFQISEIHLCALKLSPSSDLLAGQVRFDDGDEMRCPVVYQVGVGRFHHDADHGFGAGCTDEDAPPIAHVGFCQGDRPL